MPATKKGSKKPSSLSVVGWLSTSGYQTVVNSTARTQAAKVARSRSKEVSGSKLKPRSKPSKK